MIPGFFKRGFYAERVRDMLSEMHVASLLDIDGTEYILASTTTKTVALTRLHGRLPTFVELEAFGYLDTAATSAGWEVAVIDAELNEVERVLVSMITSFGNPRIIPWYIRGRALNVVEGAYGLRATKTSGVASLRIKAIRLWGLW